VTEKEIEDRVLRCISEIFGVPIDKLKKTDSFIENLNGDSLDTVELMLKLEEEFGIEIDEQRGMNIRTVSMAIALVKGNVSDLDDLLF
jgi:acyl carrier protein